jgi:hypothetical protein
VTRWVLDTSPLVHDMPANGQGALMLYSHLRRSVASATKNLGEDASIAFCACEALDAVFVSLDNNATYTALAELGTGRVATPFDVWHDLHVRGLLPDSAFRQLNEVTLKTRQNLPGVPRRLRG